MLMFAGADVSKGKVDLGLVRNIDTGKRKSKVFENTEKGHMAVVDWLLKNTKEQPENIVVTLEPTNVYHEALMYHLHDKGFKIFLANPSKARKYADSIGITHKTDKIDAFSLAFFGHARQQRLKYWVPEAISVSVGAGLNPQAFAAD